MSKYQDAINSAVDAGMSTAIATKIVNKLTGFNVDQLFCHRYSVNYGDSVWYTVLKHPTKDGVKSFDTYCDKNGRIVRRKIVYKGQ